jgi:hypothetical protein
MEIGHPHFHTDYNLFFFFSVAVHVCMLVHPPDSINVNNVFADRAEQLTYLPGVTACIKRANEIFVELYRDSRNKYTLMKTKIDR